MTRAPVTEHDATQGAANNPELADQVLERVDAIVQQGNQAAVPGTCDGVCPSWIGRV